MAQRPERLVELGTACDPSGIGGRGGLRPGVSLRSPPGYRLPSLGDVEPEWVHRFVSPTFNRTRPAILFHFNLATPIRAAYGFPKATLDHPHDHPEGI